MELDIREGDDNDVLHDKLCFSSVTIHSSVKIFGHVAWYVLVITPSGIHTRLVQASEGK